MKKVISVAALAVLLSAGSVWACGGPTDPCEGTVSLSQDGWAYSANKQGQFQGAAGSLTGNSIVGVAGGIQGQEGLGATSADIGNQSWDNQQQEQASFDNLGDPTSNWIGYSEHQYQEGGGEANGSNSVGGNYSYGGLQGQVGVAGAINDGNGTAGLGGSGYLGGGLSTAQAGNDSEAYQNQNQEFNSGYYQLNQGPGNGYTEVGGNQHVETYNGVAVGAGESATSGVVVAQAGGSVAFNNGEGTLMAGGSGSGAVGGAFLTGDKCAEGEAGYTATQEHGYSQYNESANGNQWQGASGSTGTTIVGSVSN